MTTTPRTDAPADAPADTPPDAPPATRTRTRTRAQAQARARRRDRRVYLRSHPLLFALLAATRRRPVRRLGRTLLVHDPAAYREALTALPLDRTAPRTTGGAARAALRGDGTVLFDQDGPDHRTDRRELAAALGTASVARLRTAWQPLLKAHLAP